MTETRTVTFTDQYRGQVTFDVLINPRLEDLPYRIGRFAVFCTGDVLAADGEEVLHQDMVQQAHYAIREKSVGELERIDLLFAGAWRKHGDTYGVLFQDFGLPYHYLRPRLSTWRAFVGNCHLVQREFE